jgi:thiamine kinase-like enzyme
LVLEENFSPLKVFHNIADDSQPVEKEAIEVASNVIKKINEIGIKNVPCHQDLYHANFVIYENKTILIDWEYSSMGDSYFDYADLFWQNEFDHNDEFKKSSLIEIGIESEEDIEKFEYFEMLSMITWGLWALKRSPNDNDGLMAINNAIKLSKIKKL